MARRNLTQAEIEREVERIMRGEDSDPDDFEDDGSDFEDDNLLRESESSENEKKMKMKMTLLPSRITDIASILNLPEETETADYLEKKRKTCLRRDIRTDIASILNLPEETETADYLEKKRKTFASILNLPPEETETADYLEKKRKTCFYCPSRKRRLLQEEMRMRMTLKFIGLLQEEMSF
ncbi:hypothetical protein QE152_g34123 [Popillia japonica]|uniref:Uncharacterized protein n=1 Tax=Popillia japonica TaxID=7064 RepID=A0AAW1IUH6_POPJA